MDCKNPEGSIEVELLKMIILSMSHDQNVFHAMLSKTSQKSVLALVYTNRYMGLKTF